MNDKTMLALISLTSLIISAVLDPKKAGQAAHAVQQSETFLGTPPSVALDYVAGISALALVLLVLFQMAAWVSVRVYPSSSRHGHKEPVARIQPTHKDMDNVALQLLNAAEEQQTKDLEHVKCMEDMTSALEQVHMRRKEAEEDLETTKHLYTKLLKVSLTRKDETDELHNHLQALKADRDGLAEYVGALEKQMEAAKKLDKKSEGGKSLRLLSMDVIRDLQWEVTELKEKAVDQERDMKLQALAFLEEKKTIYDLHEHQMNVMRIAVDNQFRYKQEVRKELDGLHVVDSKLQTNYFNMRLSEQKSTQVLAEKSTELEKLQDEHSLLKREFLSVCRLKQKLTDMLAVQPKAAVEQEETKEEEGEETKEEEGEEYTMEFLNKAVYDLMHDKAVLGEEVEELGITNTFLMEELEKLTKENAVLCTTNDAIMEGRDELAKEKAVLDEEVEKLSAINNVLNGDLGELAEEVVQTIVKKHEEHEADDSDSDSESAGESAEQRAAEEKAASQVMDDGKGVFIEFRDPSWTAA